MGVNIEVEHLVTQSVKVIVGQSRHNGYKHNAIINHLFGLKHSHVVAALLSRAQLAAE